jgi:hypothetical protein
VKVLGVAAGGGEEEAVIGGVVRAETCWGMDRGSFEKARRVSVTGREDTGPRRLLVGAGKGS